MSIEVYVAMTKTMQDKKVQSEDKPHLNKQQFEKTESIFLKEVGKSVMHVVTESFIGAFYILRDVGVGGLDRNHKLIVG